jgi:peptidoglycan/LPS O-acetylase OafA/YrhL
MTPVSGTSPSPSPVIGYGPAVNRPPSGSAPRWPQPRFPALEGLPGLAVPFVLAFALRADLARLGVPDPAQYLADGGYVLVNLIFVLAGFRLCRPLGAVLTGTSADAAGLVAGLVRRIAPLHLAAWAVTVGWLVTGGWTTAGTATASNLEWAAGAVLLNGLTGSNETDYPVSWAVSAGLIGITVLVAAAFATTHRPHRPDPSAGAGRRRSYLIRVPVAHPERLVTLIGTGAGAIGLALILAGPDGTGIAGRPAIGAALLGLGTGIVTYRVLEGATGSFAPPLPRTAPIRGPMAGTAAILALSAVLACVYRSDLVLDLKLVPVFPAAAALVYFLATPQDATRSPVHRLLNTGPAHWLGSRALALLLLHGPVQLSLERLGAKVGVDRTSTPVICSMLVAVTFGALAAAEAGHRWLEYLLATRPEPDQVRPTTIVLPPTPRPSPSRLPASRALASRPERIARIDPKAIPSELRLLPRPTKKQVAQQQVDQQIDLDQATTDIDTQAGK